MQGVVRHLIETGQPGSIVNILSMVVHCGQSYLSAYSASRERLRPKNVANAFAANRIRCNGILTGWMRLVRARRSRNSTMLVKIGWPKLRQRSPWGSWLSRIK
jgi:NAD(P)-dependent dehydrogenase (short-subunit alcohol dehydrogenase family)